MTRQSPFPASDETGLIGPGEVPAVEIHNPEGRRALLVIADHAGNRVPACLGRLGLPDEAFARHIAHDIGAAAVARGLADRLDAPAVLSTYSRLVLDCNRAPDDPTLIPEISDGTRIPGNRGLDSLHRAARLAAFHEPYHRAIAAMLDSFRTRGEIPWLFSVHSFTPEMNGQARPWDAGILWNRDGRVVLPLMERLRARGLVVGDNEPYSGRLIAYTIDRHAAAAGIPHATIEIRQDQVETEAGIARWVDLLAEILVELHADPALHGIR
jgi:predicted N-formylglutamate amidohydrolase